MPQLTPTASLYPLTYWWPLALLLLAVQALSVRLLLRPPRKTWRRVTIALLTADLLLVILVRACVLQMGRLDYSEQFAIWRWWFLAGAVALIALPVPLWVLALKWAGAGPVPQERKPLIHPLFLTPLVMWLLTVAATLALGADFTWWPRPAQVTRVTAAIPNLPRELDGLRLVLLTDLHTGELVPPEVLQRRLRPLAREHFDLLLVGGDITDLDSTYQKAAARVLQTYVLPGRSFAVAGNMDSGVGTDSLADELRKVGLHYLENESARVSLRGRTVIVAGLGDSWTGGGDLNKTLAGLPHDLPIILLSHCPDVLPEAAARGPTARAFRAPARRANRVSFRGPCLGYVSFRTRASPRARTPWGRPP